MMMMMMMVVMMMVVMMMMVMMMVVVVVMMVMMVMMRVMMTMTQETEIDWSERDESPFHLLQDVVQCHGLVILNLLELVGKIF